MLNKEDTMISEKNKNHLQSILNQNLWRSVDYVLLPVEDGFNPSRGSMDIKYIKYERVEYINHQGVEELLLKDNMPYITVDGGRSIISYQEGE